MCITDANYFLHFGLIWMKMNNNNDLRLLQLQSNRAIIAYSTNIRHAGRKRQPPRRAAL